MWAERGPASNRDAERVGSILAALAPMTKRTERYPVFANGRVHEGGDLVLSANDEGFLLGLSVFDTVLLEDGCLYFLEDHVERLRRGAAELHIDWPPPWDVGDAMRATADALGGGNAAVRVTLSRGVAGRGSTVVVTTRPVGELPLRGVKILVSSYHKLGGNPLEALKSTNRLRNILAREEAQAVGAWEAVLPNHDGDYSECTTANLFCVRDGVLLTPGTDRGCLSGIVREKILSDLEREPLVLDGEEVAVRVDRIEPEDVRRSSEVFLTNTTGRVIPVTGVLGMESPPADLPGAEGPITKLLRARMSAMEAAYRAGGS